jgi:DNA-binding MarR family transcriptional regulator
MEAAHSRLQDELHQSRPFESAQQEALLAVLKTADVLRRRLGAALAPHSITAQQYNVLRVVRGAGPAGIPTLSIGERLIETTPGLTRLVERLETKGWLVRRQSAADRRQVLCRLTPAGAKLLARLDPVMNEARGFTGALGTPEAARLIALLEQVRANTNEYEEQCNEVDDN